MNNTNENTEALSAEEHAIGDHFDSASIESFNTQNADQHTAPTPKKDFFLNVDELSHFCVLGYN